jgi:hypothetical protein
MGSKFFQKVQLKVHLKPLGFTLIAFSILGLILVNQSAHAAPSMEAMTNGLFGQEGVLWQAVNWAKQYYLSIAGTLSGVAIVRYYLDSIKNN